MWAAGRRVCTVRAELILGSHGAGVSFDIFGRALQRCLGIGVRRCAFRRLATLRGRDLSLWGAMATPPGHLDVAGLQVRLESRLRIPSTGGVEGEAGSKHERKARASYLHPSCFEPNRATRAAERYTRR